MCDRPRVHTAARTRYSNLDNLIEVDAQPPVIKYCTAAYRLFRSDLSYDDSRTAYVILAMSQTAGVPAQRKNNNCGRKYRDILLYLQRVPTIHGLYM